MLKFKNTKTKKWVLKIGKSPHISRYESSRKDGSVCTPVEFLHSKLENHFSLVLALRAEALKLKNTIS